MTPATATTVGLQLPSQKQRNHFRVMTFLANYLNWDMTFITAVSLWGPVLPFQQCKYLCTAQLCTVRARQRRGEKNPEKQTKKIELRLNSPLHTINRS